jgi:hypothetical protein
MFRSLNITAAGTEGVVNIGVGCIFAAIVDGVLAGTIGDDEGMFAIIVVDGLVVGIDGFAVGPPNTANSEKCPVWAVTLCVLVSIVEASVIQSAVLLS